MFHNRAFKVLSNLFLLLVLCTGQVAAAPSNNVNQVEKNVASPVSSISLKENPVPAPELPLQTSTMATGDTIRVSPQINEYSYNPSISADGRYVAFHNVVDDSAGTRSIYVTDTYDGSFEHISACEYQTTQLYQPYDPSLSADGQHVACVSEDGIVVYDMQTGDITRVQGYGETNSPSISADGHYAAFSHYGSANEIVVYDLWTSAEIVIITVGQEGRVEYPSISADGKYIAYELTFDSENITRVYVYDIQNHHSTLISQNDEGGSIRPFISSDGRYIVFTHYFRTPGTSSFYSRVFVYDKQNNSTTLVSVSSDGTPGREVWEDNSYGGSISSDGRYVVFRSSAASLVAGDLNDKSDVFVHDMTTGETRLVSVASDGSQGTGNSGGGWDSSDFRGDQISADGRNIAFTSWAGNLVSGDTNNDADVFVHANFMPEIELTGIEVTQVVQDLNNSVTLIADKPTYVRAHVLGTSGAISNVTVELAAYRDGVLLGTMNPSNFNGEYINIKVDPDRGKLEESFYFAIPLDWRTGNVTFKINEVNQPITCAEHDDMPSNCEVSVDFINGPIPNINFWGVSFTGHVPDRSHFEKARNQILETFPISKISGDYFGNVQINGLPSQPTTN
ncbi:MAG TPA: hypothetical protein VFI68_00835, partial [Anaerolineales bacterium]|nr:hypothetical protein [Anaerolineales bacterium]